MSNETDLDWLARNVHFWCNYSGLCIVYRGNQGLRQYEFSLISGFTKDQWLARRTKLQNKPSFADHPDAKCFVQDGYGNWLKNTLTSSAEVISDFWRATPSDGFVFICAGTILGDWRDTLEQRHESVPESPVDMAFGIVGYIEWSAAPAAATHHISGNNLEFSWHKNGSRIKYWNGFAWIKRSGFHTIDEARAKGFAVVARPADLSSAAVTHRLDEATQNVLAAVPALKGEQFKFEHNTKPVTVTNETVPMDKPVAVTGTGMSIGEWAAKYSGKTPSVQIREAVLNEALRILREHPDHCTANELADLHQLCDAELTKRDAAVCGGQKYLDAHWFERGELPPVGTECEVLWNEGRMEYLRTKVFGVNEHGQPIHRFDEGPRKFEYQADPLVTILGTRVFRPIRTEREVLMSVIDCYIGALPKEYQRSEVADAIFAAGFKLEAK